MHIRRAVRRHHPGPAAVGQDGQPRALYPGAGGEHLRGGKPLAHRDNPHRAGALDSGIENPVATHFRACVRQGSAGTAFAAARLDHDNRFQPCRRPQSAEEGAGVRDALDVQQDAFGPGVQGEVVEHFAEAHVRGRPQ